MSFEEAREKVVRLLERFQENYDSRMNGRYNEEQVRHEFISPFFEALGWDMSNRSGHAEQYKDVVHEEYFNSGPHGEAPDYSFRIGGQTKFFVEAKRPSINIKTDPGPAYQIRLYAWNRKLPFSLLTNFREFAIYECRKKPSPKDIASTERVFYTTFRDYPEKFREIYDKFSKHAVLHGDFDRYAESKKDKRGTSEVDAEFLKDIEGWRLLLAKDLAKRNPALEIHGLNFAVQQTIDRIIFLRIAEDRGVEKYGQLEALLNGADAYRRLLSLYDEADKKYNSGLFNFADDKLSHRLDVDDKALREIISGLYYPKSQYLFNVISADILGNVYEQFLGKVIRLTPGHIVKVEDKPEVKKAGGVYYTPQFVVDYIVKNTVGRWLEGKKPKQAEALTVLDPACGSGTFLLGAYQYLIDWHLKYYLEDGPEKWTKGKNTAIFQTARGEWRLTTKEKKRILLKSIYGVDIDRQAVEVTKLSLLLKVLEGENEETLKNLNLFGERALPSLEGNIKCGNSLIGPDFYEGRSGTLFGDEEEYRINAFDWKRGFKDIISKGGFECVIGNPPYIRIQTLNEFIPESAEYFKQKYASAAKGNYDIYVTLVEKGLSLLNNSGRLGFILPHKFFQAQYGEPLRGLISKGRHLAHAVHFGDQQVFAGATTYTNLMFLDKCGADACRFVKVDDLEGWKHEGKAKTAEIPFAAITKDAWNCSAGQHTGLISRLGGSQLKLGHIASKISQGIRTSANEIYVLDIVKNSPSILELKSKFLNETIKIEKKALSIFLMGKEIKRY